MTDILTIGNKHYRLKEAWVILEKTSALSALVGIQAKYKKAFVLVEVEDTDEQAS